MNSIKMVLAVSAIFGTTLVGAVHATSMTLDSNVVAREASELPRGSDNDKHRGKAIEQFDQIARETSELPRGSDNDKHRGKAIEQFDQIAREASELPRGSDNDKHRGKAIEQFDQIA
jgi:hypothetical protein